MTHEELLALIAQAKREGWTKLDLSGQYLTELPTELGELDQLQVLKLGMNEDTRRINRLRELPDCLGQLINLQRLDLGYNDLNTLPQCLGQLGNLQRLFLRNNNLSELPPWLRELSNLQRLDLRYNSLGELSVWLGQFTNLQHLFLSSNGLKDLPESLGQLTSLRILDLGSNNLSKLPESLGQLSSLLSLSLGYNRLSELPECLGPLANLLSLDLRSNSLSELPGWLGNEQSLPQLRTLRIANNPILEPPVEMLGGSLTIATRQADIDAIRRYFRQLQEGEKTYFHEAKLLIIGEGGAGKTSLARKLVNPECQLLPDEASTEGIDVLDWRFDLPESMDHGDRYQVNIWDFGGQEIYFATHQFFLTKRSVYLLVADTRSQRTDFYEWLRLQETFGEGSPVLLVKNRNRVRGNSFAIEHLPQLQARFANLQGTVEVDLNEVPADSGWQHLLLHVREYLLNLPHIGQPRPATWVNVRKAIDVDERDVITWDEFDQLCRDQDMKRDGDIRQLADYLHNLGDILYFAQDPVLQDTIILKPTWGLDAVYAVLDNRDVEERLGRFNLADLRALWDKPIYAGYHLHLLRLMMNFQLCYELPDFGMQSGRDHYIAPQLLTEVGPEYEWDEDDNLQLRYAYPVFMPRGVFSRAVVKLHERIEDQRLVWRYGVILADEYARAEVLELRGEKQIRIRVSGRNRRDLLMEIVRAVDELHRSFPRLRCERQIPCNCDTCCGGNDPHFYDLGNLLERLAHRKETVECNRYPYADVPIRGMVSEISRWDGRIPNERGVNYIFGDVYKDIYHGDYIEVGDMTDATGIFVGKDIQSSVVDTD